MHSTNTRTCNIFGHLFHFDAFSTCYADTICMRFRFDPLSRAFSKFIENAHGLI